MRKAHKILFTILLLYYYTGINADITIPDSITKGELIIKLNKAINNRNNNNIAIYNYELSWKYKKEVKKIKELICTQDALKYSRIAGNEFIECKALQHLALMEINTNLHSELKTLSKEKIKRINGLYNNAKKIAIKLKDTSLLALLYINTGNLNLKLEKYDQSEEHYLKVIDYGLIISDSSKISTAYNNLSSICYIKEKHIESLEFMKKAYSYKRINDKKSGILNGLGLSYYMLEKDDSALYYYKLALRHSELEKDLNEKKMILGNLANYYSNAIDKDFKLSAEYYSRQIELNNSLHTLEQNKLFAEMQEKYYTRENEIKLDKSKADLIFQKKKTWASLVGLFLFAGIFFSIYRSLNHKKKLAISNSKLAAQELENVIKHQESSNYDAVIEGQEQERQRISADLHDGLGSKLSTVKLYFGAMEDTIENPTAKIQFEKAQKLLDDSVQEIRKISKNISDNTLNKFGLLSAAKELQKVIEQSGKLKINIFDIGLDGRMNNNIEVNIYKVLQELLNNVMKHAKAKKVDISFTQDGDDFTMILEDDGIGFDILKIRSGGSGIKNLQNRLKKINGSINFDSIKLKGTTAIVTVSLDKYA